MNDRLRYIVATLVGRDRCRGILRPLTRTSMWSKLPLKFGKEDGKEVDFGHGRDRRIIPPHKIFGRVWNFYCVRTDQEVRSRF